MACRIDAHRVRQHGDLEYWQERNEYFLVLRKGLGPTVPIPTTADSEVLLIRISNDVYYAKDRRWDEGVLGSIFHGFPPILEG